MTCDGPIKKVSPSAILSDPISLPEGLEWTVVNIFDDLILMNVYELLRDHYVEDVDEMFRFHYQPDFLKWAMRVPDAHPDWYLGVKRSSSENLVAFIAASPVHLCVKNK